MIKTAILNSGPRKNATIADHIPLLKNLPGKEELLVENEYWDSPLLGAESQENTALLEKAALEIGCDVERISPITLIVRDSQGCGGQMMYFRNSNSSTKITHWRLVKDKFQTKIILQRAGISVPQGKLFRHSDYGNALRYATSLFPTVVVKPSSGSGGKGITVGVTDQGEFERAWVAAGLQSDGYILVEEFFQGQCEARFLVVDEQCVSVTGRIPPHLIGDGKSTIRELVDHKNRVRRSNPNLASKLLVLDEARLTNLARRGLSPDTILPQGETIIIDWKAGLSSGADSIQLIEYVHPSYLDLAAKVCRAMPGLTLCGVDILAFDFSVPAEQGNHTIVELNSGPGLGGHHFPVYGPYKDVATAIVRCHLDFLRKESDNTAGDLLAENLKEEYDRGENVSLSSLERDLENRNPVDEHGANRLIEIFLFGDLYDSGILDYVARYCENNALHGWARNRLDYTSSCSVHVRVMGKTDAVDGLITELRSGRFSDKITNVMVVKSRKRVNSGFRIRKVLRVGIKAGEFEAHPSSTSTLSDHESDAITKVSIKGALQGSGLKAWCMGKALSLGLNVSCRWKGPNHLICKLGGPNKKIEEFLRSVIVGPDGTRVTNVRIVENKDQSRPWPFSRRVIKGIARRFWRGK